MSVKTNAMRLLEQAGIEFRLHEYDTADGAIDALSIARKIGVEPERVFKTLVTESPDHHPFVFVIPAGHELDLRLGAVAAGVKSVAMLPQKQLFPLTGYVHGGCSPVGMKKAFPTVIEETAILYETICVSGGRVGVNLELNPEKLARLLVARFLPLIRS